jgi:hypothetical protein
LSNALSLATGVRVHFGWDGSCRWEVCWSGGPTETTMKQLVDELVASVAPSFAGMRFVWSRAIPPAAWAAGLITTHREGKTLALWELRELLAGREYPERCTCSDEARLVARLVHLAGPSEYAMAQLLDQRGLAILEPIPTGVASLLDHRRRRS